jgi:hypothetical protein
LGSRDFQARCFLNPTPSTQFREKESHVSDAKTVRSDGCLPRGHRPPGNAFARSRPPLRAYRGAGVPPDSASRARTSLAAEDANVPGELRSLSRRLALAFGILRFRTMPAKHERRLVFLGTVQRLVVLRRSRFELLQLWSDGAADSPIAKLRKRVLRSVFTVFRGIFTPFSRRS